MAKMPGEPVILASKSQIRQHILQQAGVPFVAIPSHIDEDIIKQRGDALGKTAMDLAVAKAETIARQYPGRLVIGCDQILGCGRLRFDKPQNIAQAKEHLLQLQGRTHILYTATAVVLHGQVAWHSLTKPKLTMHPLGTEQIDEYLAKCGDSVLSSVGCYQIEGLGIQLMQKIRGDFFCIMGLDILGLLHFLGGAGK